MVLEDQLKPPACDVGGGQKRTVQKSCKEDKKIE
jgi:hypothetical protein